MIVTFAGAEVPLPEHPRPNFERPAWVNLNGTWQFEFDPESVGEDQQWFRPGKRPLKREIVVPFPWESRLSGIGDIEYKGVAWYSRQVTLPSGPQWEGQDCWLVIGACDWEAKVWIDGKLAAEHVGGYVPFDVNLSRFAKPGDSVTITVRAVDITDRQQPTGKQVGWYTRTSGIWQTVYLEARGKSYVKVLRGVPDIKAGTMSYRVQLADGAGLNVRIVSPENEFTPAQGAAGNDGVAEVRVKVDQPQLWSPESPKLYSATVEVLKDGKAIDRLNTYFGLREIKAAPAPGRDYQYVYLNGKPVYLRGALHQSFHPEGIYQYPTDAIMRSDYELCKRIGINFLRIHIKAPVPRELYWADKLGVLIQEDMPNYWHHTPQSQAWYEQMLPAVIERDFNNPSIFSWVNFNETWGIEHGGYNADHQEWVEQIYHRTKQLDPTRLVEDNSPCKYDHVITDLNSWHFYINNYQEARQHIGSVVENTYPGSTFNYIGGRKQGNAPLMNSEYGGISAGHGDQDISWCFKYLTNELRLHDKICGYIYTELSDIEWEHNGFVNYDRSPKEYGYEFWHPGFSLADINGADFVVIDAPPMVELRPGEQKEIPIRISHWSDRKGESLTLRYRIDSLDNMGTKHKGNWLTRPAKWEAFKVIDQPALTIKASDLGNGLVGALLVELLDGDEVAARNYINVLVDEGQQPRVEAVGAEKVALRFSPMDFANFSFGEKAGPKLSADKVSAQGVGNIEYELSIPENVELTRLKSLTLMAELAGKAGDEKFGWHEHRRPVSYPQTDVHKWPSNVNIYINDQKLASILLPDDPCDARGALSHHRGYQGSYGFKVVETLDARLFEQLRPGLAQDRKLRIRLEVPADAEHQGGLAIFGQNVGCYPLDPTVILTLDGGHGLGECYRSDEPVAANTGLSILLPTAESGRHVWRFTVEKPADNWTSPEFDDSQWSSGEGGFGTRNTPNAIMSTRWRTPNIWLRTKAQIEPHQSIKAGFWRIYHDEDVEVHVNGAKVLSLPGHQSHYVEVPLDAAALKAFKIGQNTIAVHCRQTGGGQNVDVGLTLINSK